MPLPVPQFLALDQVLILHEASIADEFGGRPGILNLGLVQSAVDAPRNTYEYSQKTETFDEICALLAATYWYHISQNHGFADGQKRTAFMAASVFLEMNGYELKVSEDEIVATAYAVAAGEVGKQDLTVLILSWMRSRLQTT